LEIYLFITVGGAAAKIKKGIYLVELEEQSEESMFYKQMIESWDRKLFFAMSYRFY